jgi:hypothetical protein
MSSHSYGPVVLAGPLDVERTLYGDAGNPETILRPFDERHWNYWNPSYYTHNQYENFKFIPLHNVLNEKYTVYFPVRSKE